MHGLVHSRVLAVNKLSSTDKHCSQLGHSRESHKEVCWSLCCLYINDIAEGVISQMRMFADDCIVYRQIHTPADHFTLASDVNKLLSWANTWQMYFNVSKCAVLSVTTKRNISAYNYFMGSQQISCTDNQDYLGVTINTKLSWQPHINKVQNKASKTLGLLKRTLHAAPPQVRQTAYEVLVRPTLEFATCAWAPHTKTGIQTIERVQRPAERFATGDYRRTSSVSDMCTNLIWKSLYIRRRIRDATMFFLNSPRTNAHQLACYHHHSRCAHQTPTQAQTTNSTCHLHALPAVILGTLYSTVERPYRGSCHRIYRRSVPENRHPSHSDIDIIIYCFSVNHGLPAFFNVLLI